MRFDQWSKVNLVDCLDKLIDYRGKTPAKSEKGILTLSAKSVKNSNIDYSEAYTISEDEYKKFMVRGIPVKGDILITTEAPMGQVAKLDRNGVAVAQRLLTLRPNPKILDNDYLLYYLQSPIGQAELKARESGSTVTGIKQAEFRKINIILPPLSEQKAIANILSSIDDKIELNNKINKNLEELAQALYKQWFVDFEFPNENGDPYKSSGGEMIESELGLIPKGWKVLRLTDELEFERGIEPGSRNYLEYQTNSTLPFFRVGDLLSIKDVYVESKFTKGKTCKKTDVLVAFDGAIGRTGLGLTGAYSSGLRKIYSKENTISNQLIYWIMKSEIIQNKIKEHANGTTILHAGSAINYLKIPFNKEQANKLSTILNPMFLKLIESKTENEKLSKTRDTLLPKLMSGEIEAPIKG